MSRHITTGLPPQQTKHQTADQASEKEPAARKQSPEPDVHPLEGPQRPDNVIELWVSTQLRDRIKRNNAAQAQERQDRGSRRHGRRTEPDAELEAEP